MLEQEGNCVRKEEGGIDTVQTTIDVYHIGYVSTGRD